MPGIRLPRYFASTFRTQGDASADQIIQTIMNPAGSGKLLRVLGVRWAQDQSVTTSLAFVRLQRITSASNGTLLTSTKADTTDGASVAEVRGATASDGGAATPITVGGAGAYLDGMGVARSNAVASQQEIYSDYRQQDILVLREGEGLVMRYVSTATTANTTHMISSIRWSEE